MNRREVALVVLGMTAMVVTSKPADAGPITFTFEGYVTEIIDPENLLEGSLTIGAELSGAYTFESTTPDTVPWPTDGAYPFCVTDIFGSVGNSQFTGPSVINGSIGLGNDAGTLGNDLYTVGAPVSFLSEAMSLGIVLQDSTGTAFASDALPLFPPDLDMFDEKRITIGNELPDLFIHGTLTSLVPEPATILFLACGAGVFAMRSRRPRGKAPHSAKRSLSQSP